MVKMSLKNILLTATVPFLIGVCSGEKYVNGKIVKEFFNERKEVEEDMNIKVLGKEKKIKARYLESYVIIVKSDNGRFFSYTFYDKNARIMDALYDVDFRVENFPLPNGEGPLAERIKDGGMDVYVEDLGGRE